MRGQLVQLDCFSANFLTRRFVAGNLLTICYHESQLKTMPRMLALKNEGEQIRTFCAQKPLFASRFKNYNELG